MSLIIKYFLILCNKYMNRKFYTWPNVDSYSLEVFGKCEWSTSGDPFL